MARGPVGVLGLQGDFALHQDVLQQIGWEFRRVRRPAELNDCVALVVPGGESTTLHILLRNNDLTEPIVEFAQARPVLGTCAGAILMAKRLEDAGGVESWGLIDITVRRNGFGRQVDSFEADLGAASPQLEGDPLRGVFIRAPRITGVGGDVEVLAVHEQEPVAVRCGGHMALTFHPEVAGDPRWHELWLSAVTDC